MKKLSHIILVLALVAGVKLPAQTLSISWTDRAGNDDISAANPLSVAYGVVGGQADYWFLTGSPGNWFISDCASLTNLAVYPTTDTGTSVSFDLSSTVLAGLPPQSFTTDDANNWLAIPGGADSFSVDLSLDGSNNLNQSNLVVQPASEPPTNVFFCPAAMSASITRRPALNRICSSPVE